MNLSQWLYNRAVSLNRNGGSEILIQALLRLRRARLRISDPAVRIAIDVSGKALWMRLSHVLPLMRSGNRFYDSIYERLAQFLLDCDGHLTMIDVGANIGDSVVLANRTLNCSFLCVEADSSHFPFLEKNTRHIQNITRVQALVGEQVETVRYAMHEHHGTSYPIEGTGNLVKMTSVDELLKQHSTFSRANLFKIDTDGFDPKVLRGSVGLMAGSKPITIFEISPRHYIKIGKENPNKVFEFLRKIGYTKILLYTSTGLLLLHCDLNSPDARSCLGQLLEYANFDGRYFDVVAFHAEHEERYARFIEAERRVFAPPAPETYDLA